MYLDTSRLDTAKKMAAAIVRKELADCRLSPEALAAAIKASMIAVSANIVSFLIDIKDLLDAQLVRTSCASGPLRGPT